MPLSTLRKTARLGLHLGREAGAHLVATELYPFGMLKIFPEVRAPFGDKNLDDTGILFLHGVFHNRSAFALMKSHLTWNGFRHFYELNLFNTLFSVPRLAQQVDQAITKIRKGGKVRRLVIVAHSMGGIISRYYVQKHRGRDFVSHLVTLGTAHQGTYLSRFSPLPHLHALKPGSRLLAELNRKPLPQKTKALNLFGSLDLVLRPKEVAEWRAAENREVEGVGHLGILFSRRVAREIIRFVRET